MNKFAKSNLTVDGNTVRMSMPFAKVDQEKRLVSGWATLNNVDTQGDVVKAEASAKAFARARGNIREMHQPLAVGTMVDFREEEYWDSKTQKFYNGIFVTARVSKGAQDTWEKVLDGTLSGFSIGGEVNDSSNEFSKDAGRTVRYIEDYDLIELSLVDNPANQLSNIDSFAKSVLSFSKAADGSVTGTGMALETKIENVFICLKHDEEVIVIKGIEDADCPDCGKKMENAGWFESGEDRAEKVASLVTKFKNPAKEAASPSEGGVEMGRNVTKAEETAKEVGVVNPGETDADGNKIEESNETSVPVSEDVNETEGTDEEKSESPEEVVEDDATEISKKIDDLHVAVKKSLSESQQETIAKVSELEKKMDEQNAAWLEKASELEKKIDENGEKFETQKARIAELESSFNKFNRSEAFRKSAEVESPAERSVQKETFWGGAFDPRG